PYDGLVEGLHGHLEIHDCLGCPLYLDDQPWGLLTLDTLDPSRFASADLDTLEAFASLAAATVKASERMRDLTRRAEDEHQRAAASLEAAGERPREITGQSAA
ncbi:GAF domain-containing protein, partial [Pseudomonas aeruginosa]